MDNRNEIRELLTSRRARTTPSRPACPPTPLRSQTGRDPYDRGLSDLVGELSTRSEEFRTR